MMFYLIKDKICWLHWGLEAILFYKLQIVLQILLQLMSAKCFIGSTIIEYMIFYWYVLYTDLVAIL